jgi:hypothetical protein
MRHVKIRHPKTSKNARWRRLCARQRRWNRSSPSCVARFRRVWSTMGFCSCSDVCRPGVSLARVAGAGHGAGEAGSERRRRQSTLGECARPGRPRRWAGR